MSRAPEKILVKFGQTVRFARTELGYSQETFAELVGVHRTYIGDVERGTRNISLINIARIANALNLPICKLFGESTAVTK